MYKLILTITMLFTFGFTNAQTVPVQDTSKVKVIYPVGQVSDTTLIQALIVTDLNKPLVAKEYYVITDYWMFDKKTGKQPEPFKQKVIEKLTGILIPNFRENTVWSKQVQK